MDKKALYGSIRIPMSEKFLHSQRLIRISKGVKFMNKPDRLDANISRFVTADATLKPN